MWFNTVKRFYDAGYPQYTDEGIKGFVITKMITADDYEAITGKAFDAA